MTDALKAQEVGKMVGDYLAVKRIAQLKKAGITFPKIAAELSAMAFSNIEDYVTVAEGGEVQAIPLDEIDSKKLKAVKKIKEKTNIAESKDGETVFKTSQLEYELYDKADVLKYCVKLLGEEPADMVNHVHELSPELSEMVNAVLSNSTSSFATKPTNGNGKKNGGRKK